MKMIQANNNSDKVFHKISCSFRYYDSQLHISNKVDFDETIKSVSEKISIIPISLHIISTHLNGDETQ